MKLILAAALLLSSFGQSPQTSQQISFTREGPATVKISSQVFVQTVSENDQSATLRITRTTVTLRSRWISKAFLIRSWFSRHANAYQQRELARNIKPYAKNNKYILTNDKRRLTVEPL